MAPLEKTCLGPPWLVAMTWLPGGDSSAVAPWISRSSAPSPPPLKATARPQRLRPAAAARRAGRRCCGSDWFPGPFPFWGPLKQGQEKHAMACGVSGRIKSLGFLVDGC